MIALRLVFMGTPEIAVPALSAILRAGHEVICVYSQPPRPSGRGHRVTPSPVHSFAEENGILVRTPENFKSPEAIADFVSLNADVAVVMAYGLILPKSILEAPRLGCINIHVSLLPRWRGAAPIQRAIMAGDDETGVTIMQMDEGLDTGAILRQDRVLIDLETTAESLHDELAQVGAASICETLIDLPDGKIEPLPQGQDGTTYAAKVKRDEGQLDWRFPAIDIERSIRALNPWPGTWFERGGERIRILSAQAVNGKGRAGEIIDSFGSIACGDGAIKPLVMQRPGKSATDAESFLRGYDLPVGTILESRQGSSE